MTGRILHVISDLPIGGAEMMLYKVLTRSRWDARVVSLKSFGPMAERIRDLGVPVRALGMRGGVPDPRGVASLAAEVRRFRPHVVQTWMYHADVMGGVAARLVPGTPVLWNLRQSDLDPVHSKRTTVWTARLSALLSRFVPTRIVCGSTAARDVHAALGYDARRMVVIPNGFDLAAFRPDAAARPAVRAELGLAADAVLVGMAGRFDPQKDHEGFVRAAALLAARRADVHFVLFGAGVDRANPELAGWIRATGLEGRVHPLGARSDVARLQAAMELATLSSRYGEGFPNAVGEAMCCGTPCVVTDIGDSALIVGDTGRVVAPRDPAALAGAWEEVLALPAAERARLGERARARMEEHFSLDAIVGRYEALWSEVAGMEAR